MTAPLIKNLCASCGSQHSEIADEINTFEVNETCFICKKQCVKFHDSNDFFSMISPDSEYAIMCGRGCGQCVHLRCVGKSENKPLQPWLCVCCRFESLISDKPLTICARKVRLINLPVKQIYCNESPSLDPTRSSCHNLKQGTKGSARLPTLTETSIQPTLPDATSSPSSKTSTKRSLDFGLVDNQAKTLKDNNECGDRVDEATSVITAWKCELNKTDHSDHSEIELRHRLFELWELVTKIPELRATLNDLFASDAVILDDFLASKLSSSNKWAMFLLSSASVAVVSTPSSQKLLQQLFKTQDSLSIEQVKAEPTEVEQVKVDPVEADRGAKRVRFQG